MRGRVGLTVFLFLTAMVAQSRADDEAIWALIKKPGHIVLLRHSYSPESPPDAGVVNFKDCTTQRNLDDTGRAQARRIGDAFRKHGIKAARVVSSQYCRARETAALTKLGPVRDLAALNQVYLADLGGLRETSEKVRQFMKTIPARQLTVLVGHVSNFQSIAGVNLSSGEFAVVHLDASGAVTVAGRIKVP